MERELTERLREELLVATEEQAEALRRYLEQEETERRAAEILEERLRSRHDRGLNFAI